MPSAWLGDWWSAHAGGSAAPAAQPPLDRALVDQAAALLRQELRLWLFGFDVLVESASGASCACQSWNPQPLGCNPTLLRTPGTVYFRSCTCRPPRLACVQTHICACAGVHYIVDVNHFPSFSDVPDAASALRAAVKDAQQQGP